MKPVNVVWEDARITPVPSADCCHPGCQIIIYKKYSDNDYLYLLAPSTQIKPPYNLYWQEVSGDFKKKLWAPAQLRDVYWAWWKSFHNEQMP
jgi:hypothetical protein